MVKKYFCLIFFLLLYGCATTNSSSNSIDWLTRKTQLSTLTHWQIQGLISIDKEQTDNRQHINANLNWQQFSKANYRMNLFGPFGSDSTIIERKDQAFTLTTTDPYQVTKTKQAEKLLQDKLGWSVPINSVYYWIRGLPAPDKITAIYWNKSQQISQLRQNGWLIIYGQYRLINGASLPVVVTFVRPPLKIKIIIQEWIF